MDYNHAKNGLLCGWVIVLSALILNAVSFFVNRVHEPAFVFGALCCIGAIGAAYLREHVRVGVLLGPPLFRFLLTLAVLVLPCVAWAIWFLANVTR